jgi:hypothetical protein
MFNNKANLFRFSHSKSNKFNAVSGIEQAPKGEFKRLTCAVIDFDKGITILFNQCLASKPFNSR